MSENTCKYQYKSYASKWTINCYFRILENLAVEFIGDSERMKQFKKYYSQNLQPSLEEVLSTITMSAEKSFQQHLYDYIIEETEDYTTIRPQFEALEFSLSTIAEQDKASLNSMNKKNNIMIVKGEDEYIAISFEYKGRTFNITYSADFDIDKKEHTLIYKNSIKIKI